MSWWSRLFQRRTREPVETVEVGLPKAPVQVARDPAQEATILDALDHGGDALAELAVYGDWLAGQGDPRGELIALQAKLEAPQGEWARLHPPRTIEPLRRPTGWFAGEAAKLIGRHRHHFLGELPPDHAKHANDPTNLEWHTGFWRRVRFRPLDDARHRRRLAAVLAHPSAAFLHGLWLGTTWGTPIAEQVPDTLPPTLRELYLGDFEFPDESELTWTIVGDVSPIYARAPRLERLVLQGLGAELGAPIALPHLRSLEIITSELIGAAALSIAASSLPELEALVLWVGANHDDDTSAHAEVIEMLRGTFPRLRHLGIRNCADTDTIVEALVASPVFSQLRSLDLSLGTLTTRGAQLLVGARDRAQLTALDVSDNLLDQDALASLYELATVTGEDSQHVAGDHYVPITE